MISIQLYFYYIDEPPPAYEITPTVHTARIDGNEPENVAAAAGVIEPPPPYCLVDPSKVRTSDRLPHYSHIAPVEIIDLSNNNTNNGQV